MQFYSSDLLLEIRIKEKSAEFGNVKLEEALLDLEMVLMKILRHVRTLYEKSHRKGSIKNFLNILHKSFFYFALADEHL